MTIHKTFNGLQKTGDAYNINDIWAVVSRRAQTALDQIRHYSETNMRRLNDMKEMGHAATLRTDSFFTGHDVVGWVNDYSKCFNALVVLKTFGYNEQNTIILDTGKDLLDGILAQADPHRSTPKTTLPIITDHRPRI